MFILAQMFLTRFSTRVSRLGELSTARSEKVVQLEMHEGVERIDLDRCLLIAVDHQSFDLLHLFVMNWTAEEALQVKNCGRVPDILRLAGVLEYTG